MTKKTSAPKATRRQKRKADKDSIDGKASPKKRHVPASKQLASKLNRTESNQPNRDRAVLRSTATKCNSTSDVMSAEEMEKLEELTAKASRSRDLQPKVPAKTRRSEDANPGRLTPIRTQQNNSYKKFNDEGEEMGSEEEEEEVEDEEDE